MNENKQLLADIDTIFDRTYIRLRPADGAIVWETILTTDYPQIKISMLLDATAERMLAVGNWAGDCPITQADIDSIAADYIRLSAGGKSK